MGMFDSKDKKYEERRERLLDMLDDPQVQQKLRRVLRVPSAAPRYSGTMARQHMEEQPEQDVAEQQNKMLEQYKAQLAQAQKELESSRTELYAAQAGQRQLEAQLADRQAELEQLQQELVNLRCESQGQIQAAQQQARAAEREMRQTTEHAEQARQEAAQREAQLRRRFNADMDKLQQENDALDEQLEQRFPEGWELYQRWESLRSSSRQRLASVYPQQGFMSFICGGAQDESLGKIWDEMSQCLHDGAMEDMAYLQELFRYDLQLVNAAKSEPVYALAEDTAGQPYDTDRHTLDAASRAQGQVAQVLLPGYRNLYKEKLDSYHRVNMVRKSIVHVG